MHEPERRPLPLERSRANQREPCYVEAVSPLTDVHDRYQAALAEAQRFFRGEANVQAAARTLAARLTELGIPYAILSIGRSAAVLLLVGLLGCGSVQGPPGAAESTLFDFTGDGPGYLSQAQLDAIRDAPYAELRVKPDAFG